MAYALGQVDGDDTLDSELEIHEVSPLRIALPRVSRSPIDGSAVAASNLALSSGTAVAGGPVSKEIYATVKELQKAMRVKSVHPAVCL